MTTVRLHPLHMRAEQRGDEREWVVGRVETGEFIAVPPVAADVIMLLRDGLSIDEAHRRIRREQDRDVNVAEFVDSLTELGFVEAVDGVPVPGHEPAPPTFPRLRARHVRWLVSTPFLIAVAALTAAAVVALSTRQELVPSYGDLLWTTRTTPVLLGGIVVAWILIGLHEVGHLATARAFGVNGKISFSTQLQFLVAQTDVSGIWGAPRRARMIVYLSGMGVNVAAASTAILVRVFATPGSLTDRIAALVVITSLLSLPGQLLMFMRTDLYFVLQDLTGCRNLYADGAAYVRRKLRLSGDDPMPRLPAHERTAVRAYAVALAVGTVLCLGVFAVVSLPFVVAVIGRLAGSLTGDGGAAGLLDALVTFSVSAAYWTLWGRAWWRRHGDRVRRVRRRAPHTA
ncbi:hypothetical protein JIG36_13220 [Actinoplanes sp. LDG1-06]|uniref:Uncharacterized protein n=1 Tax=Paractinoplanes ovalisporus TaxID=2810368 RepID=A0ABS2A9L0_9ACTN|nr:hypothetical protein [Actinoplanes ovalisporus]MBM2616518.1 hypothetical protein [Actinoplanes ovalisporus]